MKVATNGNISLAVLCLLMMKALSVNGFCQTLSASKRETKRMQRLLSSQKDPDQIATNDTSCKSLSLFEENLLQSPSAKFGESVPLRKPSLSSDASSSSPAVTLLGDSVPRTRNHDIITSAQPVQLNGLVSDNNNMVDTTSSRQQQVDSDLNKESLMLLQSMKKRNLWVAVTSVLLAVSSYLWQFTHPITPVQLLAMMQSHSAPLTCIGTNGRPTVVDFWAPWCENCKMAAPTLAKLEEEYRDKVNFVMINGDRPEAWPLIERFGVDAIPHLALINAEGDVETALIGPIPKRVLEADLNVLIANAAASAAAKADNDANVAAEAVSSDELQEQPTMTRQELPFKMLDVFAKSPENRRIKFQPTTTELWE